MSRPARVPSTSTSTRRARLALALSRGLALVLGLATALGTGGCAQACKGDRPYVPYKVGDESSGSATVTRAEDAGVVSEGKDAKVGATLEPSLVAPPHAARWEVARGLVLTAPEGRELALALVHDVDDDGVPDALAVTRPSSSAAGAADAGSVDLVLVRGAPGGGVSAGRAGDPAPAVLLATGPAVRADAGCVPAVRLERVGPKSAFAELGTTCKFGGSSRAAVVVRLARVPSVAFDVVVVDPPSAPRLTLEVDGADRDKDGIDDVAVRVVLEGDLAGGKAAGKLSFFDRPAGPSRDPDEPEASLRAVAQQATSRASRPKDAPAVSALVQQARALYRALCDEGGAPRLLKRSGVGAISCGQSGALEEVGVAEVRAAVVLGDAVRAVVAAQSAQLAPAKRTPARTAEVDKLLAQIAPILSARTSRLHTPSVPLERARARQPEWGPLTFDGAGKLLVRGGGRVVAVDPVASEEQASDVTPWPAQVVSPDGRLRFLEAYHACDGASLRATLAKAGGDGDPREVLLPLAPPLGARCTGTRSEPSVSVPLAWGARGLEVLVFGQLVLLREGDASASLLGAPLDQGGPPGSARSSGNGTLALASAGGVLVRGPGGKSVRVSAAELEPASELRSCVASDDGTRVACVRAGKIALAVVDR